MDREQDASERRKHLWDVRRQITSIDPSTTYFAAELLGTGTGWSLRFQTQFVGWADGDRPRVELREAGPVAADKITKLWEELGRGWIAVTEPGHLGLYLRWGGNAIISESICRRYLAAFLGPDEVVLDGPVGFVPYRPDAREATAHRPTPKQRSRVLERDGYRCQLCGERPSTNEHVVLHVHHIRPFGMGGLTSDQNLITICHTCHGGLDPHEKLSLFFLPGGHLDRALSNETTEAFQRGVQAYRAQAAIAFRRLDDDS